MDPLLAIMEREEIQQAFGRRLKELRKRRAWTQKELAGKVDVRAAQLNKYEGGLHSPPFETLIKLAEVLETSVDYLLTGEAGEDVPIHSQRLLERFRELEAFPQDDRETVIKLIDALIVKRKVEGVLHAGR